MSAKSALKVDQLVDLFVEEVNSSPRERLSYYELQLALRIGAPDEYGDYDWRIQRSDANDWIAPYEEKLPARLPPAFRSLVTRYVYPELEIGDLWLFANTGADFDHEWRSAVNVDEMKYFFTPLLIANGYIQFGRPYEPSKFDAICFDTNRRSGSGEYPIVQIDHEADTIRITRRITPTFTEIINDYVNGGPGLKL